MPQPHGAACVACASAGRCAEALHASQIVDALRHMPFCVQYMQQLQDTMVFRFCAIPQIMAAGTLAVCYNNGKVFEGKRTRRNEDEKRAPRFSWFFTHPGVVKMRRGQTACVFDSCANMGDLLTWFMQFLDILKAKVDNEVDDSDPTLEQAKKAVTANLDLCQTELNQV